jgi:hypothetical protein
VTIPELPGAEPRLRRRYHRLVVSHLSSAQRVAAGLRLPAAGDADPFAATQAAWRFYANGSVSLPQLAGPPLACARAAVAAGACDRYALVVLDWSPLHFGRHAAKLDRVPLAHGRDLGYDLLTALAVSDRDGAPLAPVALELRAADGVHATRAGRPLRPASRLDGLTPLVAHVESLALGRPAVYLADREADSVGHLRAWHAAGRRFVVRADDAPRVLHGGVHRPLGAVADALRSGRGGRAFADAGGVQFRGGPARQFVAEAAVTLRRPARTHRAGRRAGKARHRNVAGEPLTLRLVVSEVRDPAGGAVLARWLLLTNLPDPGADPGADKAVGAATVARWYYWRWRIEGYHKLLKGAGQQVEQWQQETAAALARRLLVAAMACVVVWRLARDDRPAAAAMRDVLVRLSGRQMKRGEDARGFTGPALLAGLGVLLPMLELLEHHTPDELRHVADAALPGLLRRDGG